MKIMITLINLTRTIQVIQVSRLAPIIHFLLLSLCLVPSHCLQLVHSSTTPSSIHQFYLSNLFYFLNPVNLLFWAVIIIVIVVLVKCYCCTSSENQTHVLVVRGDIDQVNSRGDDNMNNRGRQDNMNNMNNRGRQDNTNIQEQERVNARPNLNEELARNNPTNAGTNNNSYGPAASSSQFQNWEQGNDFRLPSKQKQDCVICHCHLKEGDRPRVILSCSSEHIVHLSCLDQHRQRVVSFMGGNGLYKCMECKQTYSPVVKLYCNVCRSHCINLSLAEHSNQSGSIKTEEVRNTYGVCCQECRVV